MRKNIIAICAGIALLIGAVVADQFIDGLAIAMYVAAYLPVGLPVIYSAVRSIIKGNVFSEKFLMVIATVGAFAVQEFPEAVLVMLLYQIGELCQSYAVNKSRRSIAALMDIRPDYANLLVDGESVRTDAYDVQVGDIIIIQPGERVPLDCVVTKGTSGVDTSALTGESVPRDVCEGSELLSGSINVNGVLQAKVSKVFEESTASKILDLVENASSKKSNSEQFIAKFAKYYTPLVVLAAVCIAIIPPLAIEGALFTEWIYRALSFLVVSCPCALVISVPLSFFGGIGGASRMGVLVKGGNYLEALAKADTIVFDKTGTLTKGVFKVQKIATDSHNENETLEYAAYAESYSNHPISHSLKQAYGKEIDYSRIEAAEEIAGRGVKAIIDGKTVLAGNAKLMEENGVEYALSQDAGTVVHVSADGEYYGSILIADELKEDSVSAIRELKKCGFNRAVMLTGDNAATAKSIAEAVGVDEYRAELLPQDKVKIFEEIRGKGVAFVGDGINDAPVLARADVGIAMGGIGSDAAIEAADIVLMTDEPSKIATARRVAKKTVRIAYQNIVLALGVKLVALILISIGVAGMWMGVLADVGVTILAILNACRTLVKRK